MLLFRIRREVSLARGAREMFCCTERSALRTARIASVVLAILFADPVVGDLVVFEERVAHFAHRFGYTMEHSSQDEVRMTLETLVQKIVPTGQVSPLGPGVR